MDSYCSTCADELGFRPGTYSSGPLQSDYQRDKFRKHTTDIPSTSEPVVSQFDSTKTAYYEWCVQETVRLGSVAIGNRGRTFYHCPSTSSDLGTLYRWGEDAGRGDTVVAVKSTGPAEVHAYLTKSSYFSTKNCDNCGGPFLG